MLRRWWDSAAQIEDCTQGGDVPVQAAHELEAASLRGAISAAQETAEGLRAQAEEQARAASAAQEALQERLEQLQTDFASLDTAKGESRPSQTGVGHAYRAIYSGAVTATSIA